MGDSFTIRVSVTPAGMKMDSYEFYVGGVSFGTSNTQTLSVKAKAPGRHTFHVVGKKHDNEYLSSTTEVHVKFPAASSVISHIKMQMTVAWNNTLAAADASGIQEFGGAVYIDTTTEHAIAPYIVSTEIGPRISYEDINKGDVATISINPQDRPDNFIKGGSWAVATFHTHPPLWHYSYQREIFRAVGPSTVDYFYHGNLPGIVIDFVGGADGLHRNTDPLNSPKKEYIYGPYTRDND